MRRTGRDFQKQRKGGEVWASEVFSPAVSNKSTPIGQKTSGAGGTRTPNIGERLWTEPPGGPKNVGKNE
jgi:hypothetical protein